MFRLISSRFGASVQTVVRSNIQKQSPVVSCVRLAHKGNGVPGEDFDDKAVQYFQRSDIDGWDVRKFMNDMQGMDMIPEPKVISAALHACRKLNDYALAVRYLEAVKDKCGGRVAEVWPYLVQEIRPTLDELGINTPEELGYDKPELAVEEVHDMHA